MEVFRRDNHTCRYCGQHAPEVKITVDHVNPVALGGTDEPANLVTACIDCNAGKSSIVPGAELVDDVEQDALRWARAAALAAERRDELREDREADVLDFDEAWQRWKSPQGASPPRDAGWEESVKVWLRLGLTIDDLLEYIPVVMHGRADFYGKWKFFCGCAWKAVKAHRELTHVIMEEERQDELDASDREQERTREGPWIDNFIWAVRSWANGS